MEKIWKNHARRAIPPKHRVLPGWGFPYPAAEGLPRDLNG
jgi:hypothetical protein